MLNALKALEDDCAGGTTEEGSGGSGNNGRIGDQNGVVPEHVQGRDQQPQTQSSRFAEPRCVVFRYDPFVPPC
jgi:hypothetical protein